MEINRSKLPQLAQLEREAEEELRELVREHLERKCQKVADLQGRFSPLKRAADGPVSPGVDHAQDDSRPDTNPDGVRPGPGRQAMD